MNCKKCPYRCNCCKHNNNNLQCEHCDYKDNRFTRKKDFVKFCPQTGEKMEVKK